MQSRIIPILLKFVTMVLTSFVVALKPKTTSGTGDLRWQCIAISDFTAFSTVYDVTKVSLYLLILFINA